MPAVNPYLQVEGLTCSIGDRTLFRDISFGIAERQHVALIARNGTGKSTLLNVLAGGGRHDAGTVTYRRGLTVGYLEQTPHMPMHLNVLEACYWKLDTQAMPPEQAEECRLRAKQALTKLHIDDLQQPLAQLSGGQLKRVALANLLITQPDLLILDEPTNHLDLQMTEWLEAYLARSHMTLLMVTHDRYFLDRVCNIILELDGQQLLTYRGNYAYYLAKRQERLDALNAQAQRTANLYRRELLWMQSTPQARAHKARHRQEAFAQLEKQPRLPQQDPSLRLAQPQTYIGTNIFEAQYISKAYNGRTLLKDFYYCFARHEKLGIVGPNGSGKTTFIKMLLGLDKPDSGRITIGQTVRFGYYAQQLPPADPSKRAIDAVRDIAEYASLGQGRKLTASQLLQHFLFTPRDQQTPISKLSGGERRRLSLCTVLMQSPNFLILDEPTNDLDIPTLQLLEEYLQDFPGCLIAVSHDRCFLDKVADHILVFKGDGTVKDFPGNYTQYRQAQALAPASAPAQAKPKPLRQRADKPKTRLTYRERQELQALEADIDALEAETRALAQALSGAPATAEQITALSKRLPQLEAELDAKGTRWLQLSEYA